MSRTHDVTISAFDLDRLERELAAVTEQRDRLVDVINAATVLIAAKGRHNTMLAYKGLKEALAAVKGGSDDN
jgi:3-keto-L-gulonate-6-phosphate decarboxylase